MVYSKVIIIITLIPFKMIQNDQFNPSPSDYDNSVASKVVEKVAYLVDAAVVESAGTKDLYEVGYLVSNTAV